jgi:hypothetical protein
MTEPRPAEYGTATTVVAQPGNGTRYLIVYGRDFVALPEFRAAAAMTPWPAEAGYFEQKLGLSRPDAEAVFKALRDAATREEDQRILRKHGDEEAV